MILWRSKNSFCKKYSGGWTNTVRRRLLSYTCETTLSKVRLNWENQNEKPLSDLAAVSVGALLPLNPSTEVSCNTFIPMKWPCGDLSTRPWVDRKSTRLNSSHL